MIRGMNTSQAAVIEPILTTHARGYRNSAFIGHIIAPVVDIPNRAMKVLRFGKEDFRLVNARRAPGASTKRIQYGYASDNVALSQDRLEATVPNELLEEAMKIPAINLSSMSVDRVLQMFALTDEYNIATLVRNSASYSSNNKMVLSGSSKWSEPVSDPSKDMDDGKDVIRRMIGIKPNTLTSGPSAFKALKRHPKIKEQFKYTSSDSLTTSMLATYFDIETVAVGDGVILAENASDTDPASDIWGNDAILSYSNRAGDYMSPSFSYSYRLLGFPIVEQPYFDRNTNSWIYPTMVERAPYLVGAEGGFLFQSVT